ncbi:MAG: ATP-binding cassette domain-containing protein [Flammeovirgaceae bacterium]|nr:ATP-binding cassette domain-containing protein [Flammeovirgaceae bacterium]
MISIKYKEASFLNKGKIQFAGLNFGLGENENWVITGDIGSGKTSFLRCLSGKIPSVKGKRYYTINGESASPLDFFHHVQLVSFSESNKIFKPAAFFYQQRYQPSIANESIDVKGYLKSFGFDSENSHHQSILEKGGLKELYDRHLIKLSSGQRRKLLLVKAILKAPTLLLLDDPYIGLDKQSRNVFNDWLKELSQNFNIQLVIAGRKSDMPDIMDCELELKDSKIKYAGKLRPEPEHIAVEIREDLMSKIKDQWDKFANHKKFDTIIKFNNLTLNYDGKPVLQNINWEVKQAEKVALLGSNGSGKSTLLSLMYADNPLAYANDIVLFDRQRGSGESIWDIKKHTGFISPELHLFFNFKLSAARTVATGIFDQFYVARKLTSEEIELIDLFISYFGLSHKKDEIFGKLSLGEQQILLFIRALIKNPEYLLLDEPYQGMDWKSIHLANALLETLLKNNSTTLIFITHYEEELPSFIQKKVYLNRGKMG